MTDSWQYSTTHNCPCKVIERHTLWGQTVARVWLPDQDAVVRVPVESLRPIDGGLAPEMEAMRIAYVSAAAKVAEVLEGSIRQDADAVLLAPMESNVIPLPHQIHALSRAISGSRVRCLLADEVGLGKTIEAGLIMRELKLRGLVRRTLVVSPKGLAKQWVDEMDTHFNERFQLVLSEDLKTLRKLSLSRDDSGDLEFDDAPEIRTNAWTHFDQVIVSLDSVKPMERRRGWSAQQIADYNRTRFEDLVTAGWDLVIVDESHRLGGSTDQVARYKLGRGLSEAAPYFLLLSATPHQGKTDAFYRLMSLIDEDAFPDASTVSKERVKPYVIRTEKRKAIDADGQLLFKPRRTEMAAVRWEERHQQQKTLYEAVTDYVREGYNQALREKKHHIGFLMILMQRLVVSSTRAIRTTLERRLEAISSDQQARMRLLANLDDEGEIRESVYDMDSQELLEELLQAHVSGLENERLHVETLLNAAKRCEQAGADAKAECLIDWVYQLQSDENDADLKVLIFTEFVPTQQMLREFLEDRGISVACINGSMDMEQRKHAQDAFRGDTRVLISTDAGGEGLNLQFCHVVINYDIPWNPMRLEQRIGRVDRIGQDKIVRAINFVFEESVEFRVREVLEEKLAIIFEEFGIDKTGDVLDSAQAGELFEEMFASSVVCPDELEDAVDRTVDRIREEIEESRQESTIYSISEEPSPDTAERLRSHPLPHWVQRMTTSYIKLRGGDAKQQLFWWNLRWPNSDAEEKAVFHAKDADRGTGIKFLNLEDNRVRGLAIKLPQVVQGQPIPCVSIQGLPSTVVGTWGLFEIGAQFGGHSDSQLRISKYRRALLSVFVSDEGKVFVPTARHIWEALQTSDFTVTGCLPMELAECRYASIAEVAEQQGSSLFSELCNQHSDAISQEEERGVVSFESRRKAIGRIGLPEVRNFRMKKLVS